MSRRSVVLTALAWVLVVSVGATAVWSVISHAGDGVAGELPVPTTAAGDTTSVATPPESASAPGPGDPAAPVRGTWRGAAGSLVTSCTGRTISLVRVQPATGWRAEVDDSGPDRVRVELEGLVEESGKVEIESVCRQGTPDFTVGE